MNYSRIKKKKKNNDYTQNYVMYINVSFTRSNKSPSELVFTELKTS